MTSILDAIGGSSRNRISTRCAISRSSFTSSGEATRTRSSEFMVSTVPLEFQRRSCGRMLSSSRYNVQHEPLETNHMKTVRTLLRKHRYWLLTILAAVAIGWPLEAEEQPQEQPKWLLGKAYHVPSEYTN